MKRERAPYVFLCPEIRSSIVETMPADLPDRSLVLYLKSKPDFDEPPRDGSVRYVRAGLPSALRHIVRLRPRVLEIGEPLFVQFWPHGLAAATALKLTCLLRGEHCVVACYAIENMSLRGVTDLTRFRVPARASRWLNPAFAQAVRVTSAIVDRIVFGTPGAREVYRQGGVARRAQAAPSGEVVLELQAPCEECHLDARRPTALGVVFIGELQERKGVPILLEAWPRVRQAVPGATLTIVGGGELEREVARAASADPSVRALGRLPRPEIHRVLREASVLVLPSRRVLGWREQVGLPIVEGLSHGLTIVTTDETGIADYLATHGHHVYPADADSEVLTKCLVEALLHPLDRSRVRSALPSVPGRTRSAELIVTDASGPVAKS